MTPILTDDRGRDLRDEAARPAPLPLPGELDLMAPLDNPRDTAEALLIRDTIGHVRRRRDWLPDGLHPKLDGARLEHAAALGRLEDAVKACHELAERFDTEDTNHREAIYAAARGGSAPLKDERTPLTERGQLATDAVDRVWASAVVFGEVVDACRRVLADVELEVIESLRELEAAAETERQEAIRRAQRATADKITVQRRGKWLLAENDGTALGGAQPFPTVDPESIDLSRVTDDPSALTRHWTIQERLDQERAA